MTFWEIVFGPTVPVPVKTMPLVTIVAAGVGIARDVLDNISGRGQVCEAVLNSIHGIGAQPAYR